MSAFYVDGQSSITYKTLGSGVLQNSVFSWEFFVLVQTPKWGESGQDKNRLFQLNFGDRANLSAINEETHHITCLHARKCANYCLATSKCKILCILGHF